MKMYNWFGCTGWRVVKLGSNANNTASNNNVNIGSQLALNTESEHPNHASWQNT